MTPIRAGTMLGRSLNKLNKNELIREVKKLQQEISSIEDDYIFSDIDYIKKINKLQDENKKLSDKIIQITKIMNI